MDQPLESAVERRLAIGERHAYAFVGMLVAVLFVLGIGNFAIHRAVLESGHPLLDSLPPLLRAHGGHLSLLIEFAALLGAMLLVAFVWPGAAWLYLLYTMANCLAAWLILDRRV